MMGEVRDKSILSDWLRELAAKVDNEEIVSVFISTRSPRGEWTARLRTILPVTSIEVVGALTLAWQGEVNAAYRSVAVAVP